MFDPNITHQYGFHDSIITSIHSSTDPYNQKCSLYFNGEFDEWERVEHSGCRYYYFHFSDVTQLSMEEKDYKESSLIEFKIVPSASNYCVSLYISLDLGDFAAVEFQCANISYSFYRYKGMSYQNIYNTTAYQALFNNAQKAMQPDFFVKTQQCSLGGGYTVTADSYASPNTPETPAALKNLYIQNCMLALNGNTIFTYYCIYNILTAAIIQHQNGQTYFLFKEDLYGISVALLSHTEEIFHYIPEGAQHHYQQICGESFIITDIHYDAVSNLIAYGGCYWAGTNDVMIGDFSNPMHFNPVLISMHELIEPAYELYDDFNFCQWLDGSLCLRIDQKLEKIVEASVLKEALQQANTKYKGQLD